MSLTKPHERGGKFKKELPTRPKRISKYTVTQLISRKEVRDSLLFDIAIIESLGNHCFFTIPAREFVELGGFEFLQSNGYDIKRLQEDYLQSRARKLAQEIATL